MNTSTRKLLVVAVGCLAGIWASPGAGEAHPSEPLVRIDSGWIRGTDDGTVREFSGIRFARPPTGARRWRPPAPVRPWRGVADATEPGDPCVQMEAGEHIGSEDCLFLDVTVPSRPQHEGPLPVMVWLHGGGYTTGSGSTYDARRLAARGDVIVVTPNYRLGVFGYLGLEGLPGSGTFGLADQIAALRWTKRNAAAFGGDPAQRDAVRGVGRRDERLCSVDFACRPGTVRQGDHPVRVVPARVGERHLRPHPGHAELHALHLTRGEPRDG